MTTITTTRIILTLEEHEILEKAHDLLREINAKVTADGNNCSEIQDCGAIETIGNLCDNICSYCDSID